MRKSALHDKKGPRWPDRQPVSRDIMPRKTKGVVVIPPEWLAWMRECDRRKKKNVCGRANRFDEPCENASPADAVVMGNDAYGRPPCRHHGQKSGVGVANAAYKHGRTPSRYRLSGLLAGYEDRLEDLNYLALQDEIVLVEALIKQCVDVLDDETPCPEPCPLPPLDMETDGKEAAMERSCEIHAADIAIRQWHAARGAATARLDSLLDTKAKLARVEVTRVKAAQDTLSGGMIRTFGQKVLEVNRRHWLEFAKRYNVSIEDALAGLAALQEDVFNTISARGGRSPAAAGAGE